jgi:hypothetical protein
VSSESFEPCASSGLIARMEAKAIKDAAARFGSDYRPKLTFVICAKKVRKDVPDDVS